MAVPVGHGRLLDLSPASGTGRSFPAALSGKAQARVLRRNPTSRNISHIDSAERASAIFAAPTLGGLLDDLCHRQRAARNGRSWMVAAPMLKLPGRNLDHGVRPSPFPASRASANGEGFERGTGFESIGSGARLRSCAPASLFAIVRVVCRKIRRTGEQLPRINIEHHHASGFRPGAERTPAAFR